MKLTTQRLKKLIREELNKINESDQSHEDPEALTSVMNMFMQSITPKDVEDAAKSAIHYRIADKVLKELRRLKRESMEIEQIKKYIDYIDELSSAMSKPQTGPFYDDEPPLDV